MANVLGESSGNTRLISDFDTTACTTPDKPKPRMSGHKISQNMANAIQSACPRATIRFIIIVYETLRPRPIINFLLARATLANETKRHERLYENLVFDSDRGGLYGFLCSRQA